MCHVLKSSYDFLPKSKIFLWLEENTNNTYQFQRVLNSVMHFYPIRNCEQKSPHNNRGSIQSQEDTRQFCKELVYKQGNPQRPGPWRALKCSLVTDLQNIPVKTYLLSFELLPLAPFSKALSQPRTSSSHFNLYHHSSEQGSDDTLIKQQFNKAVGFILPKWLVIQLFNPSPCQLTLCDHKQLCWGGTKLYGLLTTTSGHLSSSASH